MLITKLNWHSFGMQKGGEKKEPGKGANAHSGTAKTESIMLQQVKGFKVIIAQIAIMVMLFPMVAFANWQGDVGSQLLTALKSNNSKNVGNFFGQNVSLSIKNESGYYSKFQAEVILGDFFRTTKATDVKQVQRTGKNSSNFYIVYQMATGQGSYRVFVKFTQVGGDALITELRIE